MNLSYRLPPFSRPLSLSRRLARGLLGPVLSLPSLLLLLPLSLPLTVSAQEEMPEAVPASATVPAAAVAAPQATVAEPAEHLPKQNLTPRLLYQVLLAEIAGQRGNVLLAARLYAELTQSTQDPRIAQRATEVAIYAGQLPLALEAARVWVAGDPDSAAALQATSGLLLSAGRTDEATTLLTRLLSLPPQAVSQEGAVPLTTDALLVLRFEQIQRLLARYPDKAAGREVVERLARPYENIAEVQFVRAQAAADARDETAAMAAVERVLTLRPDWVPAILFKAQLQQRNSSTEAEATLKTYLAAHPEAGEVRLAHARLLIGNKQYDAARQAFNALLQASPDNPEVLYAVALLSIQLDDFPAAEQHLKRLLDLQVGNANMLRYYLGQVSEATGRPDEALRWYQQVTPGEQFLPAYGRAATLLARQGRFERGRELLQKAGQEQPQERIPLLIAESQLLVNADRLADAYQLLDGHLRQQPDQPELLYETSLLAERLNHLDVAERHLRRLIRVKPEDAHAYNALGYTLADHGRQLGEAEKFIDKALSLAPDDAFILDSKGWLLYRRGAHKEALAVLRKAYELRADPEIAAHLGEVLWVSGQPDEALRTWRESARSNPGNALLGKTMMRFTGQSGSSEAGAAPVPAATTAVPAVPATTTAH